VLTYLHWHTHLFNSPFSGTTQLNRYQKGKPTWILLKQETVSGSGISKSASYSTQITTPASHPSVVYRPDALPAAQCPTNSVKALKYLHWPMNEILAGCFAYFFSILFWYNLHKLATCSSTVDLQCQCWCVGSSGWSLDVRTSALWTTVTDTTVVSTSWPTTL